MLAANLFKTEYNQESDPKIKARKAFMAGESYRLANKTREAEKWFEEAVRLNFDPIAKFNYGLMLQINEKYDMAIQRFTEYAREEPFNKQKALDQIKACRQAMKWQFTQSTMVIENMSHINTNASEYGPVLFKDQQLLFTSDRYDATGEDTYGWTGEKYTDIFMSRPDANGEYRSIDFFSSKINSGFNEGTPTFNEDYSLMYFTRCGSQGKEHDYCKIFESSMLVHGEWSNPVPVNFFSDTVNAGNPFLSGDGQMLLMASDAENGYGGKDLYISYMQQGQWSGPQNLGSNINTSGDEMFPWLDEEGTLYFASNGHPGMGGLDIFSATREGKIWKNPINLKPPVNSGADDFAIVFDKIKPRDENDPIRSSGFFSSSRDGGKGADDLYRFTLANKNIFLLDGIVLEKIFENPSNPNSKVIDFEPVENAFLSLKKYGRGFKVVDTVSSDQYGRFQLDLEEESNYSLFTEKEGFFNKSLEVSTKDLRDLENVLITVTVRVLLERIFQEKEIILSNIYYDYDKTTLRDESKIVLDTLVTMLNENPDIYVEIGSHTDSRGSHNYNEILSQGRAESVVKYLIQKGIDYKRLGAKGYGETKLINHCADGVECSEEDHQENRRTTFKVVSAEMIINSIRPDEIRVDPAPDN